jgi:peptide deformylase
LAILEIVQIGHPVLWQRAEPVTDPAAPEIRELANDMVDTLRAAGGLGIAAPQVGRSLRLIVVLPVIHREEVKDELVPLVIANPEWEPLDAALEAGIEGCLSIPSLRGMVPRSPAIAWRGLDLLGSRIAGEARGLLARIFQHEVDHLDGVLFPMRMTDLALLATTDQVDHLMAEAERRRARA